LEGKRVHTASLTPFFAPSGGFGPLAFDAYGGLLVRTQDGVVRVDGTTFEETRGDAGAAWQSELGAPVGAGGGRWTLIGVEERCTSATLVATFEVDHQTREFPVPILASPRCSETTRAAFEFLGRTRQGEIVSVRNELFALATDSAPKPDLVETLAVSSDTAPEPGTARSPDKATVAVTTSRGALVASVKDGLRVVEAKLWTAPVNDGAKACVPSNGGRRLACAQSSSVVLYERD
jgi:hypothetical protein